MKIMVVITQFLYLHIEAYCTPLAPLFLLSFNLSLDMCVLGSFQQLHTTQRIQTATMCLLPVLVSPSGIYCCQTKIKICV